MALVFNSSGQPGVEFLDWVEVTEQQGKEEQEEEDEAGPIRELTIYNDDDLGLINCVIDRGRKSRLGLPESFLFQFPYVVINMFLVKVHWSGELARLPAWLEDYVAGFGFRVYSRLIFANKVERFGATWHDANQTVCTLESEHARIHLFKAASWSKGRREVFEMSDEQHELEIERAVASGVVNLEATKKHDEIIAKLARLKA